MTPETLLSRIRRKIESWGGHVEVVDFYSGQFFTRPAPSTVVFAPASTHLAADWHTRTLYLNEGGQRLINEVAGLIHEAGHVFACLVPPNESEDWPFFGWEYALARELRCVEPWKDFQADYALGDGTDFGAAWPEVRRATLEERLAFAKAVDLVVDDRAVSIRGVSSKGAVLPSLRRARKRAPSR